MGNATSDRMEFHQHEIILLEEMMEISYESTRSRGDSQSNPKNPTIENYDLLTVIIRTWCICYDINIIYEKDI